MRPILLIKKLTGSKNFLFLLGIFSVIFFILLINTFHEYYTDEFDNILGGLYILEGRLPYVGFFSHHGPISYFVSAVVAIFSGESFVKFRIFYSIFLFIYFLATFIFIRSRVGINKALLYLISLVIIAFSSTYFWGHMLIADNIAALFLTPVFSLILLKEYLGLSLRRSDYIFISILIALSILSAVTYAYLVLILYAFLAWDFLKKNNFRPKRKNLLNTILIFIVPYLVFSFYLFVSGSFSEFIYQSLVFNQKYYIYNFQNGSSNNPIRYAIVIFYNFWVNFGTLLMQVKDFNFPFPFNPTLAISNFALIIYSIFKKKYALATLIFLTMAFANARTNPLSSAEKDYQSSVYIMFSLLNIPLVLYLIYNNLNTNLNLAKKIFFGFLFSILIIYDFFTGLFILNKFLDKTYTKYMGLAPLIYDRPLFAPIINAVTVKGEYAWIGPVAFEDLIYMNASLPSRYQMLIPAIGRSVETQNKMLEDFNKIKPKVIWFDKRNFILGQNPEQFAPFFMSYLSNNYITLYDFSKNSKSIEYKSVQPITEKIDIETELYINKNNFNEVVSRLLSNNLIRVQTKK